MGLGTFLWDTSPSSNRTKTPATGLSACSTEQQGGSPGRGTPTRSSSLHQEGTSCSPGGSRKGTRLLPVEGCSPAPLPLQHERGLYGEKAWVLGKGPQPPPRPESTSYPVAPVFLGNVGQVIYTEIFTGGY